MQDKGIQAQVKPGAGIGLRGWSKVRKMPGKVGCVASVSSDLAEN